MESHFSFTITDFARLVDKSPVTLRLWERKGLIQFPRNSKGDRRLNLAEARHLTQHLLHIGKVTEDRSRLIEALLTLMELVEAPCDSD